MQLLEKVLSQATEENVTFPLIIYFLTISMALTLLSYFTLKITEFQILGLIAISIFLLLLSSLFIYRSVFPRYKRWIYSRIKSSELSIEQLALLYVLPSGISNELFWDITFSSEYKDLEQKGYFASPAFKSEADYMFFTLSEKGRIFKEIHKENFKIFYSSAYLEQTLKNMTNVPIKTLAF